MAKRVAVTKETWIKKYSTQYGDHEALLEITPTRGGPKMVSTGIDIVKGRRKRIFKDVFTESEAQLAKRRESLVKDGFVLKTQQLKVSAQEAPRGPSDTEIAQRQNEQELKEYLARVR
jgi:hypothetical protein